LEVLALKVYKINYLDTYSQCTTFDHKSKAYC
jgi:hypothetical protein